jgi:hypothetical protein
VDVSLFTPFKIVQKYTGINGGENVWKLEATVLKECERMSLREVSQ